jgi:HK97 family phage prohead protease
VRRASDLEYGHGSALWKYWTRGEGFAKWSGAVHKWTTLRDLLLKAGVPSVSADGLTTNIIQAVMPGYMKQAHAAGRSAMSTPDGGYDADGLDGSWDGDCSDLPDLTGLDVADLEAAEGAAPGHASRAMPKLGTGARFKKLSASLAAKGAKDPGALAAYIGRKKLGKAKFGKLASAARGKGAKRMETMQQPASASRLDPWTVMVMERAYFRTYELEDIHIVRGAQGDSTGRLVEAYAAVWNQPAEIHDFEGHYLEDIDPAAFNKVVADLSRSRAGFGKVKVMYNHGMTIHGTPSERGSMPIATPVEIRPEARGLLTLARYSDTPFADEVLENIRNGAITAQSFTGRIVRSDPELRRGDRHRPHGGQLTRVRRTELGLKEFGPTPFEAYSGAEIVGVRMSTPGALGDPEPDENEDEALPPDEEAAAGEPLARTDGDEHSARYHQHALYRLNSIERREKAGLVW